jgi:C60 family sortase B
MEEIHNEERGERRNSNRSYKRKKQSIVHYLIPTALFISMLVFGGLFLRDFLEYKAANDEYAQLEEHIVVEEEPKEDNKGDATQESEAAKEKIDFSHPKFQIDYDALTKINSDFSAVIYIPALGINYPVVRSKDNEDYLHKTFEGKSNFAGAIFLDYNANGNYDQSNTFIFGHNMKNGSMFGKLKYFLKEEGLVNTNPYIFLCRPDGIYRYRIFTYYLTTTSSEIYNDFEGDDGYDSYIHLVTRLSSYKDYQEGIVDFSTRPKLLTLSTCSGPAGGQQRFIVQGALEEIY